MRPDQTKPDQTRPDHVLEHAQCLPILMYDWSCFNNLMDGNNLQNSDSKVFTIITSLDLDWALDKAFFFFFFIFKWLDFHFYLPKHGIKAFDKKYNIVKYESNFMTSRQLYNFNTYVWAVCPNGQCHFAKSLEGEFIIISLYNVISFIWVKHACCG